MRLIDIELVVEGKGSLELSEFMECVAEQLDDAKESLGQWFTKVQTIFYKVGVFENQQSNYQL